jgi:hypothetical protein
VLAAFVLVNTHDLADSVDAALGILRLAIPNAPAQTFDLVDDYGLCFHPAGIVGRQPACCLRRVLDPHCDVDFLPVVKKKKAERGGNAAGASSRNSNRIFHLTSPIGAKRPVLMVAAWCVPADKAEHEHVVRSSDRLLCLRSADRRQAHAAFGGRFARLDPDQPTEA